MNWFFCHVLCKFLFIWLCQVLVAAFRISVVSWGSFVAARRLLSSYDAWAWLLRRTRDLISPTVIEPVFPALEGGFLTTGSPGKSLAISLKLEIYIYIYTYIYIYMAQLWQNSSAKSPLFTSPREFWKSLLWAGGILIRKVKRSGSSFNFCTSHTNTWILCLCFV